MVEACSLWKALDIAKGEGLKSITVLWESMLVIKDMRRDPTNKALSTLIMRIHKALGYFNKVNFFHICRESNEIVDQWEKVASFLSACSCYKNGELGFSPIP